MSEKHLQYKPQFIKKSVLMGSTMLAEILFCIVLLFFPLIKLSVEGLQNGSYSTFDLLKSYVSMSSEEIALWESGWSFYFTSLLSGLLLFAMLVFILKDVSTFVYNLTHLDLYSKYAYYQKKLLARRRLANADMEYSESAIAVWFGFLPIFHLAAMMAPVIINASEIESTLDPIFLIIAVLLYAAAIVLYVAHSKYSNKLYQLIKES